MFIYGSTHRNYFQPAFIFGRILKLQMTTHKVYHKIILTRARAQFDYQAGENRREMRSFRRGL